MHIFHQTYRAWCNVAYLIRRCHDCWNSLSSACPDSVDVQHASLNVNECSISNIQYWMISICLVSTFITTLLNKRVVLYQYPPQKKKIYIYIRVNSETFHPLASASYVLSQYNKKKIEICIHQHICSFIYLYGLFLYATSLHDVDFHRSPEIPFFLLSLNCYYLLFNIVE